jgi:hypothetical protein
MAALRYGYRIMRKGTKLSRLGLGRPRDRAFFEDQATWEAANRGQPGIRAYLIEAGFGPGPMGGTLPTGWYLAPRPAYTALQKRLRQGLGRHDLSEAPGDPFKLELFMAAVPHCVPPKGQVATITAGREVKTRRVLWGLMLTGGMTVFMGVLYVAADVTVGMPGAPSQVLARAALKTGLLETLGQDALIEELRADGAVAAEAEPDKDDGAMTAMRRSLQELQERR